MAQVIQFEPIGVVRNAMTEAHRNAHWEDLVSDIIVADAWRDALDGLEQFSHIWVIFYLDRIGAPGAPRVRPMGRDDMPLVGRFATRTPARPNPIGICAVALLQVRGNVLRVRGLDALDGTPVLDLKPYLPRGDAIPDARVSDWVRRYSQEG